MQQEYFVMISLDLKGVLSHGVNNFLQQAYKSDLYIPHCSEKE